MPGTVMDLTTPSKAHFQHELNESRVVTRRNNAAEVAWIGNLAAARINRAAGRFDSIEIADRVGEIDPVKEIEELRTQLEIPGLTDAEVPGDRQVDVRLERPSQA